MQTATKNWSISLADAQTAKISVHKQSFISASNFLTDANSIRQHASLQKFAKITPQYPGVRSALPPSVCNHWLESLTPLLTEVFGAPKSGWRMEAWFSIVTTPAKKLLPLQCFPHVDGTDPNQIAMMLYLHDTPHGGTGFFRHKSSGLETLTAETFPVYRAALENDVRREGLPPPAYNSDGGPFFERTYASEGEFNQAIFYRGNQLHSGIISNDSDLSPDPLQGRLTINAFFRPNSDEKSAH